MKRYESKSKLRILSALGALILYLVYAFLEIYGLESGLAFGDYYQRMEVLAIAVRFMPYFALLVFALAERKTPYVNKRLYLLGFFLILLCRYAVLEYVIGTESYPDVAEPMFLLFEEYPIFNDIIVILTVIAAVVILIAHKALIKTYSYVMLYVCVFSIACILIKWNIYNTFDAADGFCVAGSILLYISLYNFNELVVYENRSERYLSFLRFIGSPVFGGENTLDHMTEKLLEELEEEDVECDSLNRELEFNDYSLRKDYMSLLVYAVSENNREVLTAAKVVGDLSKCNAEAAMLYDKEFIIEQYESLLSYGCEKLDGEDEIEESSLLISLRYLLDKKDDALFVMSAMICAAELEDCLDFSWCKTMARIRVDIEEDTQIKIPVAEEIIDI